MDVCLCDPAVDESCFQLVVEGVEMRSLCKPFIFLALVLFIPAAFVGCGPSRISSDEIPTDIGDEGEEGDADDNAPADE
jgi:hypothetical protein